MRYSEFISYFLATPAYRATFRYILSVLFSQFRWRFLRILVLSFIAAGTQVAAILMIVNSVNILASGGEAEIYGFSIALQPDRSVVFSLAGLPALLLIISAVGMYRARRQIANLMIDYHGYLDRCVYLGVASVLVAPNNDQKEELLEPTDLTAMLGKDGRFAGRVVNEVANSVVPVLSVICILPILVYLDWVLFSLLGFLLLGSLAVYGWVGRQGAGITMDLEAHGAPAALEKRTVLKTIMVSRPPRNAVFAMANELRHSPKVNGYETAYSNRLTIPHLGGAVGSAFLAITSFVVLVYFGLEIVSGTWDSTSGVTFVLLFVYMLISIRTFGRSLTNMNVFYPYLRRIVNFILSTQDGMDNEDAPRTKSLHLKLEGNVGGSIGYVPSNPALDVVEHHEELCLVLESLGDFTQTEAEQLLSSLTIVPSKLGDWHAWLYSRALLNNDYLIENYPVAERRGDLSQYVSEVQHKGFSVEAWDKLCDVNQAAVVALALVDFSEALVLFPLDAMALLSNEEREYLDVNWSCRVILYRHKRVSTFARLGVKTVINCTGETPRLEQPGKVTKMSKAEFKEKRRKKKLIKRQQQGLVDGLDEVELINDSL